jgi:hypothetical protein
MARRSAEAQPRRWRPGARRWGGQHVRIRPGSTPAAGRQLAPQPHLQRRAGAPAVPSAVAGSPQPSPGHRGQSRCHPVMSCPARARQRYELPAAGVMSGFARGLCPRQLGWALAQPVRVGLGVFQAELHLRRQRPGGYQAGGVLKGAAPQAHGVGRFEPHRPPGLPVHPDLGEFRDAPRHGSWRPDLRQIRGAGQREPATMLACGRRSGTRRTRCTRSSRYTGR